MEFKQSDGGTMTYLEEIVHRLGNAKMVLELFAENLHTGTKPSAAVWRQYERSLGDIDGACSHLPHVDRWLKEKK